MTNSKTVDAAINYNLGAVIHDVCAFFTANCGAAVTVGALALALGFGTDDIGVWFIRWTIEGMDGLLAVDVADFDGAMVRPAA